MTEAVRVPARAQGRGHQLLRDHLTSAMWVIPTGFAVGAFALALIITRAETLHDAIGGFGYRGDRDSAETMLATIATAMLAFIGVVFTITIVALQLASGQLSPRVMRIFQRDRRTQVVLGIFLATFVFSLSAIAELGETRADIAPLMVAISGLLVFASLGAFVFFVHHITVSIRAAYVIEHIAQETRRTIDDVYPTEASPFVELPDRSRGPVQVIRAPRAGVIAAVDFDHVANIAIAGGAFVVLSQPVGAYVADGDVIFEVFGASPLDPRALQQRVDLAVSRTMYQDVEFGFRQLVDIAERALSPAVNDPTTAVQALDRIGDLLGRIADRPDPPVAVIDGESIPRVLHSMPTWAALVDLAFEEVRWFGRESIQISRRLLAILDDLERTLGPERRHAVATLRARIAEGVVEALPESLHALAMTPDHLGIGGDSP